MTTPSRSPGGVFMRSAGGVRGGGLSASSINFVARIEYDWYTSNTIPKRAYATKALFDLGMPDIVTRWPGLAYSVNVDMGPYIDQDSVPLGYRYVWYRPEDTSFPWDYEAAELIVTLDQPSFNVGDVLIDSTVILNTVNMNNVNYAVYHAEKSNYVDIGGSVTSYNAVSPHKLENATLKITPSQDVSVTINGVAFDLTKNTEQSVPLSVSYIDHTEPQAHVHLHGNVSWRGGAFSSPGVEETFIWSEYEGFPLQIIRTS